MQQPKQDPVDPKRVSALKHSANDTLPLIADLLNNRSDDAAKKLLARIDAVSAQLGGIEGAAEHARARVAAAVAGDELKVSDLQLISALSSEKAAADTGRLRRSNRLDAAARQVEIAAGTLPNVPVIVMAVETSTIGVGSGEDHGTYMRDAGCVVVIPAVSDHTLRHELVHATQPQQIGCGPHARIKMIEGVTDALAREAGSDGDDLSYAKEAAAVLGWGEALERDRLEWLRELNSTPTPEITMGATIEATGKIACDVFFDAEFAAEGFGRDFDDRVEAATKVLHDRLSQLRACD